MKRSRFRLLWLGGLAGALTTAPTLAATWNLDPAGTGDAATIQEAYDLAAPGDVIVLAPGTYTDSITRTIQGHSTSRTTTAVAFVSPGVDIASAAGPEVTFIDGQADRHGLFAVDAGSFSVGGITFVRGARAGGEVWGGALMVHRSTPTIEDCVFDGNDALNGGAVFLSEGADAIVRRNKFVGNTADGGGGAIEVFQHGGTASVTNNTFVNNVALIRGGAVFGNQSTLALSNNIYAGNSAPAGGAVACLNGAMVTGACDLYWQNSSNVSSCAIVVGENGNREADPRFCHPAAGVYTVQSDSPAAPTDPEGCGLRGACGVGCGPVSVEASSWGRIKDAYR